MKQYALLFACLFFLCVGSKAQEQPTRWTLRACLDYALEHNIQVKKSKVSHLSGIEDTKQAKAQLFPSLSASVTQGFVNYPSSDAATNNSYSGNYALNAKWTLFDGGQRVQAIKQQEIQNTVDELGIEKRIPVVDAPEGADDARLIEHGLRQRRLARVHMREQTHAKALFRLM